MKIRGSAVSLSFIFPHPPEDKKENKTKNKQKTVRPIPETEMGIPCNCLVVALPYTRWTPRDIIPLHGVKALHPAQYDLQLGHDLGYRQKIISKYCSAGGSGRWEWLGVSNTLKVEGSGP